SSLSADKVVLVGSGNATFANFSANTLTIQGTTVTFLGQPPTLFSLDFLAGNVNAAGFQLQVQEVSGSGTITANTTTVAKQFTPGVGGVTVNGAFSFGVNCQSNFTLAGVGQFSKLNATGGVTLNGTLDVTDLFPLGASENFPIVTGSSIAGNF